MNKRVKDFFFLWLPYIITTIVIVAVLFFITYYFDYYYNSPLFSFFFNLFRGNPNTFRYSLTAAATSLAATLGIMVAIIILIVQLTANRYTPKVTDLFITHRGNLALIAVFVVSIIYTLWISYTINEDYIPRYGGLVAMGLMTWCYAILIPYFLYVLNLLKPTNIITQIRDEALQALKRITKDKKFESKAKHIINTCMEQITDIAISSVQSMDNEISHRCIWALQGVVDKYIQTKHSLQLSWYYVDESHMVGFAPHVIEEIVKRQAWVEFRALRHMMQIFDSALHKMSSVNSAIAQAYRAIGTVASELDDKEALNLVIRYYNTILRTTIRQNDVRSNNDTLYQYRLLGERIIDKYPDIAKDIAYYLSHYALLAVETGRRQNFESAVYDLRKINERALKRKVVNLDGFLEHFLKLQYKLDHRQYFNLSKALWKAYAILASFYLFQGEENLAKRIYREMKRIPIEVILELKMEILQVAEPHFWEITDRIISYNYVPDEQKEALEIFFDWFLTDLHIKD